MNSDSPDGGWEEYKKSMEEKGYDPVASAQLEAWEANFKQAEEGQRMNTNEVVEMIDAITEGAPYAFQPKVIDGEPGLAIRVSEDEVSIFGAGGFATGLDDPRTAREIAGALVAWADRKDGGRPATETLEALQKVFSGVPSNCITPRVWNASGIHRRYHKVHGNCPADEIKKAPENNV